ncbi:Predicted signal transduction protein with a C-terminal ATPase domain [Roseburia intestinalis XB6B4]|uniref:histidine kinase n=1 Tax=Roseburia intestinalis XB6B4 TaxID=718255 RepID=D4KYA4_9FIRM|nr:sensor histidine kinase [Roseburia intestinalis]CBL12344.1 Predicted signal transduction protein with a C-terminal ATPase domain [Roseburia intestinalis XB6B4]
MSLSNIKDKIRELTAYIRKMTKPHSIQMTISISFTILSICCSMTFLGVTLYRQFSNRAEAMTIESTGQLLNQTAINLEDYLRNMRRISDTMYYSVIKNKDLASDTMDEEMNLLYEANKDNLISIACYTGEGQLVAAVPVANEKSQVNIVKQQWFTDAVGQMENLHFSTPHVQNLFGDPSYRYYWVVSLSRAVELTSNGTSTLGVLLVDMNYNSIEQILKKANVGNSSEYVYLIDGKGEIIYHPRQKLIYTDLYQENNIEAAGYEDGSTEEIFQGEKRLVTVKTVSYTGWKIVSVVPMSSFDMGMTGTKYFVIMLVTVSMLAVILLNQLVSASIAMPLKKLNNSVKEWETGNMNPSIYIGGSMEVEHLGCTLRSTVEQIRQLMQDIVVEQEEKRKSELDALQSQINPHFLYNTLDSIVWMIEGERYEDAVFMITQLASLFRISLSRGKTVISVEDELKHARNYMNIQKVRYKNIFEVRFDIDPEILQCCTVKLVVQPLLENAIYYGVECMDGDGEIDVNGYRREDDIYIEVRDNGLGIPEDEVEQLLKENNRVHKRGSGVGLLNVHNRIRLRFGEEYGLEIESEPDEGTTVRIHLPYIVYTPEEQERLESGRKQL